MQFANDAEWIGREVERVWRTVTEDKDLPVAPEQAKEVQLAIESTRQLGRDTWQKQIVRLFLASLRSRRSTAS